jgi:hypothetical protein
VADVDPQPGLLELPELLELPALRGLDAAWSLPVPAIESIESSLT